eukprot:scaffold3346_cov313-Pinguiococcus_pyrenoidosus.AAC.4
MAEQWEDAGCSHADVQAQHSIRKALGDGEILQQLSHVAQIVHSAGNGGAKAIFRNLHRQSKVLTKQSGAQSSKGLRSSPVQGHMLSFDPTLSRKSGVFLGESREIRRTEAIWTPWVEFRHRFASSLHSLALLTTKWGG